MIERPPREKEWVSWAIVALWSLFIFVTIPFARVVQGFVQETWGSEVFVGIVVGAALLLCLWSLAALRRGITSVSGAGWLIAVGATFAFSAWWLRGAPEEAMHLLQYGVLGLLAYRALTHRLRDPGIYLVAIAIGALVGTLDEAIQWLTPNRYWGMRDVWINLSAVTLAQLGIALGLRPALVVRRAGPRSLRVFCRLAICWLTMIGLAQLNTSTRAARLAQRSEFFGFLASNESTMAEYGFLYTADKTNQGQLVFRSRLSPEALDEADAQRGEEVAAILDAYPDRDAYLRFLEFYTPVRDPFAHEARVHIFRRDRYMAKALRNREKDPVLATEYATVAVRENQIVEGWFPETLRHSRYVLAPARLEKLHAFADLSIDHESGVSDALITRFTETQIVSAIGLLIVALFIVERAASRKLRAEGTDC